MDKQKNILSKTDELEILESELIHSNLRKLEEMDSISWNQTTNELSKGPQWDEIAPILTLMYDNQDELPDRWF
ncbi:hypothetical protein [Haloarcula sediminis]|uniref:hypothetical protein n=1 Tax=Haloarcula sediminis TaxID=3111777 RepID=UPI002D7756C8|nr:hypothetical protein [Haloarcula sp. CK38]